MYNQTTPEFDIASFLDALGPILIAQLGGEGKVASIETRRGTFNRVVKFAYAGRILGVRVAENLQHFRYERGVVKEVFAISLLHEADGPLDDDRVGSIVEDLLNRPIGSNLSHPLVRRILHYDWSRETVPYPFFIFEWIEGGVLWEMPAADNYHRAGKLLAGLHRMRFESFYENIFSIHHLPRSWRDHLRVCLNRELARADLTLPSSLTARLAELDLSKLPTGRPCLVHNDFSGANVVISETGAAHVIDWDNWVVDCPELDLVKMKYWTAIGREGRLTHRSGLYDAFLEGYQSEAIEALDEQRLKGYEYLWLLRGYNFEMSREASDDLEPATPDSWRKVYPDSRYYADLLRDL